MGAGRYGQLGIVGNKGLPLVIICITAPAVPSASRVLSVTIGNVTVYQTYLMAALPATEREVRKAKYGSNIIYIYANA